MDIHDKRVNYIFKCVEDLFADKATAVLFAERIVANYPKDGVAQQGHYDSEGYCDNPARGY